jgi:hypothetical protein
MIMMIMVDDNDVYNFADGKEVSYVGKTWPLLKASL